MLFLRVPNGDVASSPAAAADVQGWLQLFPGTGESLPPQILGNKLRGNGGGSLRVGVSSRLPCLGDTSGLEINGSGLKGLLGLFPLWGLAARKRLQQHGVFGAREGREWCQGVSCLACFLLRIRCPVCVCGAARWDPLALLPLPLLQLLML